ELAEETVEFKLPARVQFVFIEAPNITEIGKRCSFELGSEDIVYHLKAVFHISFQFNFPQLVEVSEIEAQAFIEHLAVIIAGAQRARLPRADTVHPATEKAFLENQQARVVAIGNGYAGV